MSETDFDMNDFAAAREDALSQMIGFCMDRCVGESDYKICELEQQRVKNAFDALERLTTEISLLREPMLAHFTEFYNHGYLAGHNDTVEGCYTDVLPVEIDTFQSDVVEELIRDMLVSDSGKQNG